MPNWVENDLTIRGPKDELKRFKEFAKGTFEGQKEVLSAEKFIPYEGEWNREWCVDNWGTKWGFCHSKLSDEIYFKGSDTGELIYNFDTAWSPALPLIKKMGEMFPLLEFDLRYFEGGMQFNGMLRIEKGKVVVDESGSYFGQRGG